MVPGVRFFTPPGRSLHGTMSIDVTAMVKTWLSGGRPNNGFVLGPHDPAPDRVSNTECLTQYGAPTLTLQYR
jgi:hypothetical protein